MRRLLLALVAALAAVGMFAGPAVGQEYPPPDQDEDTEVLPDEGAGEVEDQPPADETPAVDPQEDGQAGDLPATGGGVLVLAGLGLGLGAAGAGGVAYARRRAHAEARGGSTQR